jgi:hypothetical protein
VKRPLDRIPAEGGVRSLGGRILRTAGGERARLQASHRCPAEDRSGRGPRARVGSSRR